MTNSSISVTIQKVGLRNINCFIPFITVSQTEKTVKELQETGLVNKIYLLAVKSVEEEISNCETIIVPALHASTTIHAIVSRSDATYTLLYTKHTMFKLGLFALERMVQILEDTGAGMIYADRYRIVGDEKMNAPVIDYQFGSLRDDFDFGPVLLYKADALKEATRRMKAEYKHAGLYDFRLKLSQKTPLVHINEYLYSEIDTVDTCKSNEKMFDYVDPKNREVQIEMEQSCTEHLKEIGGYLPPNFKKIAFKADSFGYEASVIIPVRNRVRTIEDAIRSVLNQKTD
ncbi:hypothetical protein EZS27_033155, partial [termite gut metagenome]